MTKTVDIKKEYQWSQNWPNSVAHTDIKLVVSELKNIEDVQGQITPGLVVESSKNKRSVLHNYFEWDNDKAANSWRVLQAAKLLRHIEVKVVSNGEAKFVRVYETISRAYSEGTVVFKKYDKMTEDDSINRLSIILSDLKGIKTRLERLNYNDAAIKINSVIEELSVVTENKLVVAV